MRGGKTAVLPAFAVVIAGCAGDGNKLGIRAIPDPLTKATRAGNPLLAEARGLLAVGSIGLAIEAFRKALRDRPDSVEALAGLAECYDRMGRYDLSRSNYEAALAVAPKNALLLRTFAASLQRQGRGAEARALRSEADRADARDVAELVNGAQGAPPTPKVAVPVKPEMPAGEARPVGEAASASAAAFAPPRQAAGEAPKVALPTQPGPGAITVKLPPARPAPARSDPVAMASADEQPAPNPAAGNGPPRLLRISLAEVALVTAERPRWRPELVRRTATSTTVRFVPLAELRRSAGVRLLNAARHQGLAARTRVALTRKGWNRVSIGDAAKVRQRSLVLYSPATIDAARRLAAEFGFGIAKEARPGPLTVLLGRDAVPGGARG